MVNQMRSISLWHWLNDDPRLRLRECSIILEVGRVIRSSWIRLEGSHLYILAFEKASHDAKSSIDANDHQAEQKQDEGNPKNRGQACDGGAGMNDNNSSRDQNEKPSNHTYTDNDKLHIGERQRTGSM